MSPRRRSSVYTLSFDGPDTALRFVLRAFQERGQTLTGSGADPRPYVMFRVASDEAALALAHIFPSLKNTTLTTGQGVHTRTITIKENTVMAGTKYDVVETLEGSTVGTRARKDTAIKLGEGTGRPFEVRTQTGEVVYTSPDAEAPAPADTTPEEKPVKETKKTEPAAEERQGWDLEFEGLGKYYAKAAGLHGAEVVGAVYGVEASLRGTTITLYGAEEDVDTVIEKLVPLWHAAKVAHRDWRKADAVYSAIDKSRKNAEANAQRFGLETAWFQQFMDGAADALAGKAKRKGGAYKDGVHAAENPGEAPAPAPASDIDDVI